MGKSNKLRQEITASVMSKFQEIYGELNMPATEKSLKKNKKLAKKIAKNLAIEKRKTDKKILKEQSKKIEENEETVLVEEGKASSQNSKKAVLEQKTDNKKLADEFPDGKENKKNTNSVKPKTQKRNRKKPSEKVG